MRFSVVDFGNSSLILASRRFRYLCRAVNGAVLSLSNKDKLSGNEKTIAWPHGKNTCSSLKK